MQNILDKIKKQISENKLIIYIKGTPVEPLCSFSTRVIRILNLLNLEYSYVNVLEHNDIREALPLYAKWPTFPQVYYKGNLIGGADIIVTLFEKNELKRVLTD